MSAKIEENEMKLTARGGPMIVDIAEIWNDGKCIHCGSSLEEYGEFKYCFEGTCDFVYIRHYTKSGNALFELCYNQGG
jgi:hypothetical protein